MHPSCEVLALQENVAKDIAQQIRARLTPQEQAKLNNARAVNPAAYEAISGAITSLTRGRPRAKQRPSSISTRRFATIRTGRSHIPALPTLMSFGVQIRAVARIPHQS
jgi:hypothetical protein